MTERYLKWVFFIQCQILLLLAFSTEGFEGGADAVCHWLISRDAPTQPMLFLDQWNKPIFTVLSAPFAQFGMLGMRIFSALTGILTGLLLYLTARNKMGEFGWMPAIMLLFVPQYIQLLTSSMTEPLFAFFLALFMFLVAKRNLGLAALVAGFSPYVRQEGFALILVAVAVLVYASEWKKSPLVLLGTAALAVIGWSVSGRVDWILTSFPYSSAAAEIYGSGELFHYLKYYRELFGIPISILFACGLFLILKTVTNSVMRNLKVSDFELAIAAGSVFGLLFFSTHSFVWWKGMSASLGLTRVMACISPAIVLTAVYVPFKLLDYKLAGSDVGKFLVSLFLIVVCSIEAIAMTQLPTCLDQSQTTIRSAAEWVSNQNITSRIHYFDPVFSYFGSNLNIENPIDKESLSVNQVNGLNAGEVIVWDAQFAANEGQIPLDSLMGHPFLEKIRSFHPKQAFAVYGGQPYAVHVFRKSSVEITKFQTSHVLRFENFEDKNGEFLIEAFAGRNGSHAAISDSKHEFVTIRSQLSSAVADTLLSLEFELWVKIDEPLGKQNVFVVTDASGLHYEMTEIRIPTTGEWTKVKQSFELPTNLPEAFELRCYVWNPNGKRIYLDDFKLTLNSLIQMPE